MPNRPLLVLLDGHSSHYEPASIELAKTEGVIIFCLPPHTTQDSQPLDCTVFGPLKRHWSAICQEFQQKHPGMVISKLNFTELFVKAWLQALTPANIVAGFHSIVMLFHFLMMATLDPVVRIQETHPVIMQLMVITLLQAH